MRKSFLIPLIAFVVLAVSSPLLAAQQPQSAKDREAAGMAQLKKMLGLTNKQSDSIQAIMKKTMEDMRKIAESKESSKTKAERQQAIGVEAQKKFMAVLTPAQKKKLMEMAQARMKSTAAAVKSGQQPGVQPGPKMTFMEVVRAKLSRVGLTKQQKAKTDAIMKDFEKRRVALKKDAKLAPDKRKVKADALKDDAMTKIKAVLTPEQRKKLSQKI